MRDPSNPVCRTISTLLSRIGDKWTVLVVTTLGEGPRRFNELRREIPSVSQRMLTLTLRNLERDGLVSRTVTPSIPRREVLPDRSDSSQRVARCGIATRAGSRIVLAEPVAQITRGERYSVPQDIAIGGDAEVEIAVADNQ